ncbi:MAG: enoyl-CoA hydratase/isomerase family protein, partial [Candidatus Hodarchaeota archaeon]
MEIKNYEFVNIEKKGKIAIIKFNRQEKKNALSEAMRAEIIDALQSLKEEKRVKAVIFYGGEEFFSAGFDRDEVQAVVQGQGDY